MNECPWKSVHFIGIGGAGMMGLALILADRGVKISGSDEAESTNTKLLRTRHIPVTIGHAAVNLKAPDLVIHSSAIIPDNPELMAARQRGVTTIRRGEFLAQLAAGYRHAIAIAGSHGKSTVSAMVAHLLRSAGLQPGFLVGAEICRQPVPAVAGNDVYFVTEVDESDGTQALLKSSHAIITNIDDDHYWSLGGKENLYRCFYDFAAVSGYVVTTDTPITRSVLGTLSQVEFFPESAIYPEITLSIPGQHNRLNASLAITLVMKLGIKFEDAVASLQSFAGVDRRLTMRHQQDGLIIIEDYAHHPAEVHASINALREAYPGHQLTVVFQPHRYERVKRYGDDFARELSQADIVMVTTPFEAWMNDGFAGGAQTIAQQIKGIPASYHEEPYPELANQIATVVKKPAVVVVMGAGSITQLPPLLIQRFAR